METRSPPSALQMFWARSQGPFVVTCSRDKTMRVKVGVARAQTAPFLVGGHPGATSAVNTKVKTIGLKGQTRNISLECRTSHADALGKYTTRKSHRKGPPDGVETHELEAPVPEGLVSHGARQANLHQLVLVIFRDKVLWV